jgi:hypothetical protein
MSLLTWFDDDVAQDCSLTALLKDRFVLQHFPRYIIEAALMQPWAFVHRQSLGDEAARLFLERKKLIGSTKHYSRTYSVVLTKKVVGVSNPILNEQGRCIDDADATICWMTRYQKLMLFADLINTHGSRLGVGRKIVKEMLPLCYMLHTSEWLLRIHIKNEDELRDRAKRNHAINFLYYYHPQTYVLAQSDCSKKPTPFQFSCCAGYMALTFAEKCTSITQQHALLRWLKKALSYPRQDYWDMKAQVNELFHSMDELRTEENNGLLETYTRAVMSTYVALTANDPLKEKAASGPTGYRYMNNPKPISDRASWFNLLPTHVDYTPSLVPAANPIRWTSFYNLETITARTGDFLLARKLTDEWGVQGTGCVVFENSTRMQIRPILLHYNALCRRLSEEPYQIFDIYLQKGPAAVLCWNSQSLRRLQCLSVCLAAGSVDQYTSPHIVQYQPLLPLGQLLHIGGPVEHQLDHYLLGLYLLIAGPATPNSKNPLHIAISEPNAENLKQVNQIYDKIVTKLMFDPNDTSKTPYAIPLHTTARQRQYAIMSFLLPHCPHLVSVSTLAMLQKHNPGIRSLILNYVKEAKAFTPEWQDDSDPLGLDLDAPSTSSSEELLVLGHDSKRLTHKWHYLSPAIYLQLLQHLAHPDYSTHDAWTLLYSCTAVAPCKTAHLQKTFDHVPYPSDWTHLTIPVDREIQSAVPMMSTVMTSTTEQLPVSYVFWVVIHALLSGLPSFDDMFDENGMSNAVFPWTNLDSSLRNCFRQPVIMRDLTNHTDHGLYDTFLLGDTILPAQNRPLNNWFESLMDEEPALHPDWIAHMQGTGTSPVALEHIAEAIRDDFELSLPSAIANLPSFGMKPKPALPISESSPRLVGKHSHPSSVVNNVSHMKHFSSPHTKQTDKRRKITFGFGTTG